MGFSCGKVELERFLNRIADIKQTENSNNIESYPGMLKSKSGVGESSLLLIIWTIISTQFEVSFPNSLNATMIK